MGAPRAVTVATWVTLSRFFVLPIFLFFLLTGAFSAALGVFVVLVATDWLDGQIARRFGQTSELGAWLDPLADKFLVLSALVGMVALGMVGVWPVVLLLWRELFVTAMRGGVRTKGEAGRGALFLGKGKVVCEYGAIFCLLLGWSVGTRLLWGSVVLAWGSVYPYWRAWR